MASMSTGSVLACLHTEQSAAVAASLVSDRIIVLSMTCHARSHNPTAEGQAAAITAPFDLQ
jgi:hypothetical protein